MSNLFFKLDSGEIVNLAHVRLIKKTFMTFSENDNIIIITEEDFKRISQYLKFYNNKVDPIDPFEGIE